MKKLNFSHYESFQTWLFDCDGVLYQGNAAIPGAKELITKLQREGKRIFFITNNSLRSRKELREKFTAMGITVDEATIVSTASVAALYLKSLSFKDKVYLVGSTGMAVELDDLGIRHTGLGPDPLTDTSLEYLLSTELDPEVKCVLVGIDYHVSYRKILKAASYIKNQKCMFLGTNEDTCLPLPPGAITVPGTGSLVRCVAVASDTEPVVLGKPNPPMFETLREAHGLDPASCVIVGDSLHTDIPLGLRCGLKTIFVLSGYHSLENAQELPEAEQPHFVIASVKEIAELV